MPRAVREGALGALIVGALSIGSALASGQGPDLVGVFWLVLAIGIARGSRVAIAGAFLLAGFSAVSAVENLALLAFGLPLDRLGTIASLGWIGVAVLFVRAWRANEALVGSRQPA